MPSSRALLRTITKLNLSLNKPHSLETLSGTESTTEDEESKGVKLDQVVLNKLSTESNNTKVESQIVPNVVVEAKTEIPTKEIIDELSPGVLGKVKQENNKSKKSGKKR